MEKKIIRTIYLSFIFAIVLSCSRVVGWQELKVGKEYYEQSNYEMAEKKYTQAIEKNPDHWKFHLYRGMAYKKMNKIDLSIADLSACLNLIPKSETWYGKVPSVEQAGVYMRRGTLYHEKKEYKLAINDYNKTLEYDPNSIGGYYYRGIAKEAMNQFSAAIIDYTKAVDMMLRFSFNISDSEKERIYLNRANVYRKQNKLHLALEDNNQAIKMSGTWNAFLSRGITQSKIGDFEKAISDYDKTIQLNPFSETAYLYRASTRLITSCDLNKVLEDYYSLISINIDNETRQEAYNQIAWILATATDDSIRDVKKALIYAKKSVEIKTNCRNLDTLAVAFAGNGKFEDAIETHKQAIDFCKSNNPELLSELEKHLEYYKIKKNLREECPGERIEKEQLRKWLSE